ncbi:MAG: PEP-CTERM sorting domain-containing protein, partial [Telluria sp.]
STPSLLAFDLDLTDFSSTRLEFVLEGDDLLGPLAMNALIRNLSGHGVSLFTFQLDGIAFAVPGSVTPTFGTVSQVRYDLDSAAIAFATPEFAEFHFGNPVGQSDKRDWFFDTTGLRAGGRFAITASIPEPSPLVLILSALGMLGLYGARRQRR